MIEATAVDTAGSRATLRDATPEDAEFLAWVMLTATRSHLPRGIWDFTVGRDEIEILDLLAKLNGRGPEHLFHHGRFLIAEVDGQPAAALSGYDPVAHGYEVLMPVMFELAADSGWTEADLAASLERYAVVVPVLAEPPAGAWVIESVATAPEYRRHGLVDRLMPAILDRGRELGFSVAQISVFIGNEPARCAYLKHGFEIVAEARTPEWEAAMGCPGLEHMLRSL